MHSSPDDAWVSFLGGVYDITQLLKVPQLKLAKVVLGLLADSLRIVLTSWDCRSAFYPYLLTASTDYASQENPGPLAEPLIHAAGEDISHWWEQLARASIGA